MGTIYPSNTSANMIYNFNQVFNLEISLVSIQNIIPIYKEKSQIISPLLKSTIFLNCYYRNWRQNVFGMPIVKYARDLISWSFVLFKT